MKPFVACIAVLSVLPACSSAEPTEAKIDAGSTQDTGVGTDGGTQCAFGAGAVADLALSLVDSNYDGAVVVSSGNTLVSSPDAMPLGAALSGTLMTIPEGTTLWANLHQKSYKSNPYAIPTVTNAWTLRASEQGPILAGGLADFASSGSTARTFLGVPLTTAEICSRAQVNNVATGESCLTTSYFNVTIRGDQDLTLAPGSTGHVSIGGIEYEVWALTAYSDGLTTPKYCIADWSAPVGLRLVGRAVRMADVLR